METPALLLIWHQFRSIVSLSQILFSFCFSYTPVIACLAGDAFPFLIMYS
jgi:hypothetical protein